jgi:protein phosphatase
MIEAFGLSDPGSVRPNNEDYFISDTESGIFILADGMGGANAGEYASHLSAETVYDFLLEKPADDGMPAIERAFLTANHAVREAAASRPEFHGMGTTLLVARDVGSSQFEIASVGDSRAYLLSAGELSVVTEDQTWAAEVGPRLGLTEEALRKHPMRHVLTMAVGSSDDLRVSSYVVPFGAGDQLLLCSDGLHGVLGHKILHDALESEQTLPDKCHYLIEAAIEAGGPDNVTVLLIQRT